MGSHAYVVRCFPPRPPHSPPSSTHPVSHSIVFAPCLHAPTHSRTPFTERHSPTTPTHHYTGAQSAAALRDPAVAHTATHVGHRWCIAAPHGDNYAPAPRAGRAARHARKQEHHVHPWARAVLLQAVRRQGHLSARPATLRVQAVRGKGDLRPRPAALPMQRGVRRLGHLRARATAVQL